MKSLFEGFLIGAMAGMGIILCAALLAFLIGGLIQWIDWFVVTVKG